MVAQEMFKQARNVTTTACISAKVLKTITYNKGDGLVMVLIGTLIKVDVVRQIALIGNDHVEVTADEYAPLSQ